MNNLLNSGTILKKKQSTMPKNFKMRNFMLQVIGLKCGRLDVCFKVIAAEEKAVTPEMTISWWETHHGTKSSRQVSSTLWENVIIK